MDPLNVHLDGIPTEIRRLKIDLKQLILDIENPRIQYFLDRRSEYLRYAPCAMRSARLCTPYALRLTVIEVRVDEIFEREKSERIQQRPMEPPLMPEAYEEGGYLIGILTVLGFLTAFVLSKL